MFARGDGSQQGRRPEVGSLCIEVNRVLGAGQTTGDIGAPPCLAASSLSFSELRPTRIGSGQIELPSDSWMPPSALMAAIDRARCWLPPILPVTPFITIPTLRLRLTCVALYSAPLLCCRAGQARSASVRSAGLFREAPSPGPGRGPPSEPWEHGPWLGSA